MMFSIHASGIKKSKQTFPDFHFKINYKYRTSSDKHPLPGAYLISKLNGAALLDGST